MKTIRVRIAVAVNGAGDWGSYGVQGESDEAMTTEVVDYVADGYPTAVYFVEADVPVPETPTIEGTVTQC